MSARSRVAPTHPVPPELVAVIAAAAQGVRSAQLACLSHQPPELQRTENRWKFSGRRWAKRPLLRRERPSAH